MSKPLNRKDLYDLVWNKPMSTIAKEYGLSDRGIAKLCERHSVPVPPRGYWAQKAAGQKISKPPLIVIDKKEPETAILLKPARANPISTLNTNPKTVTSLPASVQEAIAHEALPEHIITVPATLHHPHRIIEHWMKTEAHEAELDKKFGRNTFFSKVTPLERRKRRILSALFIALEARGFKITQENKHN